MWRNSVSHRALPIGGMSKNTTSLGREAHSFSGFIGGWSSHENPQATTRHSLSAHSQLCRQECSHHWTALGGIKVCTFRKLYPYSSQGKPRLAPVRNSTYSCEAHSGCNCGEGGSMMSHWGLFVMNFPFNCFWTAVDWCTADLQITSFSSTSFL